MAGIPSQPHMVPHYDIHGHQHHRVPFKDKSHLFEQDIKHSKWLDPAPGIKTRAELQQARKRGRVPDPSYDFDGDGVVGQLDYFVGRSFDKDASGSLSLTERGRAQKAIENGFLDKYMRGLDSTGSVHRGCTIQQKRGVILTADNAGEVSVESYPPHFNAHVVPPHNTKTSMQLSRTAELKGAANAIGEAYAAANAPITEPNPPNSYTHPRTCHIQHIRERAEADHQASRARAGLLPMNSHVNPERQAKTVGLGRVENPMFATRGQLMETRKEAMKRECEQLREKGEEICVPLSVRRTEKEAREFAFRQPDHEPMTLTRLKLNRKQDKTEYDMANFSFPKAMPRDYPRFSERPDVPFWVANDELGKSAEPPRAIAKTHSEPALKVNEIPFGNDERTLHSSLPESAHAVAFAGQAAGGPEARYGSNTVKRWTTDMLERGQGRNKPRLFDSIQPLRIGPLDLKSLDLTSSMEVIRTAALKGNAEDAKRGASMPKRSRLWADGSQQVASQSAPSQSTMHPSKSMIESRDLPMDVAPAKGGQARAIPKQSQSDPALRTAMMDKTGSREPAFFGDPTMRPSASTGIRCGGFQKMEWPMQQTGTKQKTGGRTGTHGASKERLRSDTKEGGTPLAAASLG